MARKDRKDRGLVERPRGSGIWWVRMYFQGKEKCFKVGAKSAARAFYEKLKTEEREHRLFPEKYQRRSTLLSSYMNEYLATCTKRTVREDRRFAAFWSKVFPARILDSITPSEIEQVRIKLLEEGKSKATINRYAAFLKHIYSLAIRDGKVDKNPVVKVRLFKESPGRIRFLTEGEEIRLREVMDRAHWSFVAFAVHTGLRQAEQFRLRWENVDLENRVITIPRSKSGETRHIPINDEALTILRGLSSWMTSAWVFPSENPATPIDPRNFYRRVFIPAVKKAGLEGICWHTLRHTFASRLVMKGVDLRTVQELMGHKTIAMTQRYAHLSPRHLLDAVNRLVPCSNISTTEIVTVTKTVTEEGELKRESSQPLEFVGAPDTIRTCDTRFRKPLLYPSELRGQLN